MMMKYKVCFHMSYTPDWTYADKPNRKKFHGKMHYCGNTLEEAVAKVRRHVTLYESQGRGTCTSMWIMRGDTDKKNIKWADYHSKGEPKKLKEAMKKSIKRELGGRPVKLFPFGSP